MSVCYSPCGRFLCPRDRRSGGKLFLSGLSFCHSVLLSKTLTLLITFEQWVLELRYFTWIFPVIRCFCGYHYYFFLFLPVTLTLELDPFFENFNLSNNFWTVSVRALIFHMSIPCDKSFLWVPLFFTLWLWPLTLLITFEQRGLEFWYFTWVFLVIRPFRGFIIF